MAKQETALSELVKNAYDADATIVIVDIAPKSLGNYIEITDDGTGMSHEDIVQGFMRLATSEKISHPLSPLYHRRRAGRKGVGRLAAERLGEKLILTTTTVDDVAARQTTIDWQRFKPGMELGSVSFAVRELDKSTSHGTTIRIEGLRDNWSPTAVERTFEHVAELIDPAARETTQAAAFEVSFLNAENDRIVDLRSQVADQAFAVVSADVDGGRSDNVDPYVSDA